MNNVMVDLETLSSGSHAAIVSIGAVFFDEYNLGSAFYLPIRGHEQQTYWQREISQPTLDWWAQQSASARAVLTDPQAVDLRSALESFAAWLGEDKLIWGNGATFDNVILANAYKAVGLDRPWSHRNDRCYRTLRALAAPVEPARAGTHHNALDDAIHQAKVAQVCFKNLVLPVGAAV